MRLSCFFQITATTAAIYLSPAVALAKPPPPPAPLLLDCPVLPAWCDPTSPCKGFRSADEYHFIVNPNDSTVTMLYTPHVSQTVSDSYVAPQSYAAKAQSVNSISLAWSHPNDSLHPDSRFILWRDTLALDVTTVTPEGKIVWHGTCSKVSKQMV